MIVFTLPLTCAPFAVCDSQGKLKTGEAVAVKVQRPYVLETVTIDLFILRAIGVKVNEIMDGKVRPTSLQCAHFLQASPVLVGGYLYTPTAALPLLSS